MSACFAFEIVTCHKFIINEMEGMISSYPCTLVHRYNSCNIEDKNHSFLLLMEWYYQDSRDTERQESRDWPK